MRSLSKTILDRQISLTSHLISFVVLVLFLNIPSGYANESQNQLTPIALFHRCYSHLTGIRAPRNHPLLQQVRNGTLSAVDACIQVLDKARFNSNGQLLTFSEEGVSVLNHLNKFHMSWFTVRDFKDRPQTYTGQETLINDATEPGLFLTHLLFNSQNPPYSDAIKGSYSVRGIRSEGPYKAEEGKIISPYSFPLAALEYGKLRGVYKYASSFPSNPDTWYTGLGDPITSFPREYTSPALPSYRSHGGGIIGSQSFLWMNGGFAANNIRANGAERMPRKWVRALFTDLMCRDLPVLRTSDVSQPVIEYLAAFTDPATRIAFRSDTLCASCHETVDPGSSAIRGQ